MRQTGHTVQFSQTIESSITVSGSTLNIEMICVMTALTEESIMYFFKKRLIPETRYQQEASVPLNYGFF